MVTQGGNHTGCHGYTGQSYRLSRLNRGGSTDVVRGTQGGNDTCRHGYTGGNILVVTVTRGTIIPVVTVIILAVVIVVMMMMMGMVRG